MQGGCVFSVKAIPGAKKTGITGTVNGAMKVKVATPPEDGKANEAIREIIALKSGVRIREVQILKGFSSRNKVIKVNGVKVSDILKTMEDKNERA